MDRKQVCDTFRRLAIDAGAVIMEIYEGPEFEIRSKSDDSPVTIADTCADAVIFAGLRQAFPQAAIVTEEQADTHATQSDTFFIVDPLDGTKEFVHRRGDFTVNIALVESGVPTLGVVYAPAKGRLFITDETGAVFEESVARDGARTGDRMPVRVSAPNNAALIVVASKSHRDQATDDYIAKYRVSDMTGAGSSLKFCLVATGEADLYPRLGRTMEWDTAAGQAILQGAGGRVVRFDDHTPLIYGKPEFENPFFIAYAPGVELKNG